VAACRRRPVILLRKPESRCSALWIWTRAGRAVMQLGFTRREHLRLALPRACWPTRPAASLLGIVGQSWSTAGNASILILLEPVSIVFLSPGCCCTSTCGRPPGSAGLAGGPVAARLVIVLESSGRRGPVVFRAPARQRDPRGATASSGGLYSPPPWRHSSQRDARVDVTFGLHGLGPCCCSCRSPRLEAVASGNGGPDAAAGAGLDAGARRAGVLRGRRCCGSGRCATSRPDDRRAPSCFPAAAGPGRAGRDTWGWARCCRGRPPLGGGLIRRPECCWCCCPRGASCRRRRP